MAGEEPWNRRCAVRVEKALGRNSTVSVFGSKGRGMSRKSPRMAAAKQDLILDAAQRRFAVYGLNKVTMDEIAGDIGMGKASLYYYFPTKEDLFRGVIQREQHVLLKSLNEIRAADISAGEKLRRYVDQRLRYFAVLVNLRFLNLHSWLSRRAVFRDLFESFAAEEQKVLTEILRAGKKSGEFEMRSPEATAAVVLHALQGLRLRAARMTEFSKNSSEVSHQVKREMRHLVELLVRGLNQTHSHRSRRES
jgi:TetR/AcrR family transcriptional regulator